MKTFTRILTFLMVVLAGFYNPAVAQTGVLDPGDPIVVYNPSNPPTTPAFGTMAKWVKTNRLSWNTTSYKAYFYKNVAFRLKFPKTYQHNVADGKKYPIYVFFHGVGEKASNVYDNEYQLYHGGQTHMDNVDNGNFDGYLLYIQSTASSGSFGDAYYTVVKEIVQNYIVPQVKGDINRVYIDGLSGGGSAAWEFTIKNPTLVAAVTPISANSVSNTNAINSLKFTPIWNFQGGLDNNPAPTTSTYIRDSYLNAGANYTYTEYPNVGHGCWYNAWAEADYYPFMNRAHKANPWPLTGRTEFCPGDAVNLTLGVTAGFDGYEWRKDGVTISGATSNTYVATALGTYDCRIKRGTEWSPWSPQPVVLKIKSATVSPTIQISGLASKVVPSPDGKTGVTLIVPSGYAAYDWQRTDNTTTLSTQNTLANATAGDYKVKVTEKFGCTSAFSDPFTVINANGANGPDAPAGLAATVLSKTEIKLSWSVNPNAAYGATNYEVYQAASAGGPYALVSITASNATAYTATGLTPKTAYYFKVRAVNNNAASTVAGPANATTLSDVSAPTAPTNLRAGITSQSSVELIWDAASDDVAVTAYDVYINSVKSYVVAGDQTRLTCYNLSQGQSYTFAVKARDFAGNVSPFSNQVLAAAALNGLNYKYYQGTWSTLPDFNALTPAQTGIVPNVNLNNRLDETNFGYLWQGYINIPVTGTYTFQTSSDDGSKLYIDSDYTATATANVNNDGLHGTVAVNSTAITLTAGVHKFAATFFQQGGGYVMNILWKTPQTNGQFVTIPDSAFAQVVSSPGPVPAVPSNLTATAVSYKQINLSWNDNSNNEIAFEIYRSTSMSGTFTTIGRALANQTTFVDTLVQPVTKYFYKIKAINQNGASKFNGEDSSSLLYNYYEANSFSSVDNMSTLTPFETGRINNFDISVRNRDVNYGITYDGYINIPTAGSYTFYTSSDDGSKLFIDGTAAANLVVNNDGAHGVQERSGAKTLTAGLHSIRVSFYQAGGGQSLSVSYQGPSLTKRVIPDSVLNIPPVSATTQALPGSPAVPTNFTVAAQSTSKVLTSWSYSGTPVTGFELYRSSGNNQNYALLTTVPAATGTISYADSGLFANAVYYYKVRAINEGGYSAYTSEASATTLNNVPVAAALPNKSVRYDTQLQVNFTATDTDNEQLTTIISNLPSFGSFLSTGNGTATITFSPTAADQGVYNNITVTVNDQHGGTTSRSFNLTVNDNYNPVITGTNTVSINEGTTSSLTLNANDQNAADAITWSFTGLPSFITTNVSGTGSTSAVTFNIKPGFSDFGTYSFTASTSDGRGGSDDKIITVTVNDVNPNRKIYVNFKDVAGTNATGYWNNLNASPTINKVFSSFTDDAGVATTVGLKIMTNWQNVPTPTGTTGVNTGNNSGVYPDAVISTFYWTNVKQTFKITGLDTSSLVKYKLTFFGSRGGVTDNRTAQYTVNGTSVTLNGSGNSTNTVFITNLKAATDSSLSVDIQPAAGSTAFSYINALVIERLYDDQTAPVAPKNFNVSLTSKLTSGLTWDAVAYNDNGYQIYRSTTPDTSNYTLIATTAAKANSYVDSLVSGNFVYNYKVRAVNSYGTSPYTDIKQIAIPNRPPVLAAISSQVVRGDQSVTVALSATYDANNTVALLATSLPSFVTLTDNGNGTGSLTIAPTNSQLGTYTGTVTAKDNHNSTSTQSFTITVKDKDLTNVYVNFNQTFPEPLPWNSFNSAPNANVAITNLKDDSNTGTGMNITLLDAWTAANEVGAVTGNNSGVFPDNVMKTAYYEQTTNVKRIKLSGLSTSRKYNLVFFGSRIASDTRITKYTAGGQTVQINTANNTSTTAQINGLSPNASGEIEITVVKDAAAPYAYINALVIQSYASTGIPLAPSTLVATGISKSSIKLAWADRSDNETGFEISRSTSYNGTFTVIDSVAANVTTYTNTGLGQNSKFFYRVRAKAAAGNSSYSNIAAGATFSYLVSINFNRDQPAGAPWNNTNNVPSPGDAYQNFVNDINTASGINLTIVDNFTGDNSLGMNTGNNSGIYPDNVIRSAWFTDAGSVAKIKIDGLNQAFAYNFVFLGSRNGNGDAIDRTTIYTIGTKTASLNATNNISQITQILNVTPDENGAVFITIQNGPNSPFGYLNSLVIQAYSSLDSTVTQPVYQRIVNKTNSGATNVYVPGTTARSKMEKLDIFSAVTASAFPNPFVDDITVRLSLAKAVDKLQLVLRDVKGHAIFAKDLRNVPQGVSQQKLGVNGRSLASGEYFIEVIGLPDSKKAVVKVLK